MEHNDDILTETAEAIADVVADAADAAAEVAEPVVKAAKKTAKRTKAAAKTASKRGRKVVEDAAKSAETAVESAAKAVRAAVKPEVFVQVDFNEVEISNVVENAKADFRAKNGRVAVKSCKVYVKPLERAAYYVINDDVTGRIDL